LGKPLRTTATVSGLKSLIASSPATTDNFWCFCQIIWTHFATCQTAGCENTSHERPTFEQATPGAHTPKGQSTHGASNHVPKQKVNSDARASAYSHTLVSHTPSCALNPRRRCLNYDTLVCPTPTPCLNYDAVLLHTSQRSEPNTRSTTTHVPPGTSSLHAPAPKTAMNP
jgi:hypothetical protein